ncbi:MAG: response regulator transcription factor [Bdellovibrionaceae bacterium]|nr:response regulator transcription factor [Pseudobdellovibrionaceae bacterium]
MTTQSKLGEIYKRVLLIEDNSEICEFYKDFFDSEGLSIDIFNQIPWDQNELTDSYDILICDWLVGVQSSQLWLTDLYDNCKLPDVTLVSTGMFGVEDEISHLPVKVIYKPFDFEYLKKVIVQYNQF